jgi:hypothetical protein
VDDFIGASISGATMLGQLRRMMLRCEALVSPAADQASAAANPCAYAYWLTKRVARGD